MTVHELIEELKKVENQSATVRCDDTGSGSVGEVLSLGEYIVLLSDELPF